MSIGTHSHIVRFFQSFCCIIMTEWCKAENEKYYFSPQQCVFEKIKCKLEMTANGLCYNVGVIIVCEK